MVTIEVNLSESEELPEQHLDEGESIERLIVPLSELYDKLKGTAQSSFEYFFPILALAFTAIINSS